MEATSKYLLFLNRFRPSWPHVWGGRVPQEAFSRWCGLCRRPAHILTGSFGRQYWDPGAYWAHWYLSQWWGCTARLFLRRCAVHCCCRKWVLQFFCVVLAFSNSFILPNLSCHHTDFVEVMKCEHERAVHLFVDSLMNKDHVSYAFQCTGPDRFKKGICLSCRKNRCNSIGYNAKKMRNRRNSKMYLKTRAVTPFGGK